MPKRAKPGTAPRGVQVPSAWADTVSGPRWTPASLRAALDEHESGVLASSAALAESVGRDCVVFGALATRVRALSSRYALPFCVEPGEGDKRRLESVRERIEELWWTACPEDVIEPILRDAIMLGVAVGTIWWERSANEWIPHLRHLAAHGLEYVELECAWYYTTNAGDRLLVTPGDGTWFLHLPHGERSYMWGAVRAIAEPWLERRYAQRDRARWCERHGMPVLAVKEPHFASDDVEGAGGEAGTQADAVYAGMRRGLGSGAVIRLPQGQTPDDGGWSAEWLELRGTSFEGFASSLKAAANDIDTALLGRPRDGGAKGGDGELASETGRNEYLSSDAEPLTTSIRNQVWKPYVAFNVDQAQLELAAWGRWDTSAPPNKKVRAETLKTLGEALALLKPLGADVEDIAEEFGVEVVEEDAVDPVVAPAAPAPAPAPPSAPADPPEPSDEAA